METKKPMTTAKYFDLLCSRLREKGEMPDGILEYCLATCYPTPITTYEFTIRNSLNYGDNEGIYLDLMIEFYDGERRRLLRGLGTCKTLHTSPDAMRKMSALLADFLVEDRSYVNSHLDDFTWSGVDVYALKENGDRSEWSYTCKNEDTALKRKDELLEKYPM